MKVKEKPRWAVRWSVIIYVVHITHNYVLDVSSIYQLQLHTNKLPECTVDFQQQNKRILIFVCRTKAKTAEAFFLLSSSVEQSNNVFRLKCLTHYLELELIACVLWTVKYKISTHLSSSGLVMSCVYDLYYVQDPHSCV